MLDREAAMEATRFTFGVAVAVVFALIFLFFIYQIVEGKFLSGFGGLALWVWVLVYGFETLPPSKHL